MHATAGVRWGCWGWRRFQRSPSALFHVRDSGVGPPRYQGWAFLTFAGPELGPDRGPRHPHPGARYWDPPVGASALRLGQEPPELGEKGAGLGVPACVAPASAVGRHRVEPVRQEAHQIAQRGRVERRGEARDGRRMAGTPPPPDPQESRPRGTGAPRQVEVMEGHPGPAVRLNGPVLRPHREIMVGARAQPRHARSQANPPLELFGRIMRQEAALPWEGSARARAAIALHAGNRVIQGDTHQTGVVYYRQTTSVRTAGTAGRTAPCWAGAPRSAPSPPPQPPP